MCPGPTPILQHHHAAIQPPRRVSAGQRAGIAAAALLSLMGACAALAASQLRGTVLDERTRQPLAARIYLQSRTGAWHFVKSASPDGSAIRYEKQNWVNRNAVEIHTTISAHPFLADLPPGQYTLLVERGKEYFPETRELVIGPDPVNVSIPLRRWVNMADRRWFSGEMHLHRTLDELRNVVLAEDLNVSFPLTYWVTSAFTPPGSGDKNTAGAIPDDLIPVDPTHVIWPRNTEYEIFTVGARRHTLGALFILNHQGALRAGVPPMAPAVAAARDAGALLDMDKLDWPFALSLPHSTGAQLYELVNNHMWRTQFGFTTWTTPAPPLLQPPFGGAGGTEREWVRYTLGMYYALLDCGFNLLPAAGTANGVHPVPAGFGRVYVHLPDGFSYERWLDGLRHGRSFVTTGPMLLATANDQMPGEVFRAERGPVRLRVSGAILSEQPLSFVEIIHNGLPARTIMPQNTPTPVGAHQSTFSEQFDLEESGWLAVRCWEDRPGGRFRFAHTAPWHVQIPNRPLRPQREEKQFLVQRMKDEIQRSRDVLPPDALAEYTRALAAYERIETRDDSADIRRQARTPTDDADLRYWLGNMVWHHRFTPAEIRAATGLDFAAIDQALARFRITSHTPPPRPKDRLLALPYPGGRHPRLGFFEGAIDPQRDTKISVFLPWDDRGYVVVDVPEAIFSNLGLLYLAHTHVPTIWSSQGQSLPRIEWNRRDDGSLDFERTLPNGVAFGAKVVPARDAVRMELWLRNGAGQKLTGLRVQNCIMLGAAPGFAAQTNQNKLTSGPYAAVRSDDGRRWIITAWDPCQRTWCNPPLPCMHSDPQFPDCPPGQTRRLRGWLSFYEGPDIQAELKRIEATNWRTAD